MATESKQDKVYWHAMNVRRIKEEYAEYLKEEGRPSDPHMAHLFAIKKIAGGFDYLGIKERDLILLLAGSLPYMYD